mmetsp:Transcript_19498/g.23358  ORF Transcript_19498/g.23358 Transcript_19498/m.23358 type:complete len:230 (+) Transcript_19498:77-766(+)
MPEYGHKAYWEDRYATSGSTLFDWYMDYDGVLPSCKPYIAHDSDILIIGCGNSNLSEELYDDGYKKITSIDYSEVAISLMSTRSINTRPELKYLVMDATVMQPLAGISFDACIDKGTMDSMLCLPQPQATIRAYLKEINRVLKPGGKALIFSYGNPHERMDYFEEEGNVKWKEVNVHVLPKPSLQDVRDGHKEDFSPKEYNPSSTNSLQVHFVYTLSKAEPESEKPAEE